MTLIVPVEAFSYLEPLADHGCPQQASVSISQQVLHRNAGEGCRSVDTVKDNHTVRVACASGESGVQMNEATMTFSDPKNDIPATLPNTCRTKINQNDSNAWPGVAKGSKGQSACTVSASCNTDEDASKCAKKTWELLSESDGLSTRYQHEGGRFKVLIAGVFPSSRAVKLA